MAHQQRGDVGKKYSETRRTGNGLTMALGALMIFWWAPIVVSAAAAAIVVFSSYGRHAETGATHPSFWMILWPVMIIVAAAIATIGFVVGHKDAEGFERTSGSTRPGWEPNPHRHQTREWYAHEQLMEMREANKPPPPD